ncbi:VapA/VapB family virulence-associated protein [Xenorhabdus stockiae]|uniref:VapA/VapB family virulence-associated protein n=1 Tax=Xenorhabdus stockiae TaxID=351614 RepID=UPI003CED1BA8
MDIKFIESFKRNMEGKLEPSLIDDAVKKMLSWKHSYAAIGVIESVVFYIRFDLSIIIDRKHFGGNSGGLATPGIGSTAGLVMTDDLETLYSDTVSFYFESNDINLNLQFLNSNNQLIGIYTGGAVSIVSGFGGGTGSWD